MNRQTVIKQRTMAVPAKSVNSPVKSSSHEVIVIDSPAPRGRPPLPPKASFIKSLLPPKLVGKSPTPSPKPTSSPKPTPSLKPTPKPLEPSVSPISAEVLKTPEGEVSKVDAVVEGFTGEFEELTIVDSLNPHPQCHRPCPAPSKPLRRLHTSWTKEEEIALRKGVEMYGHRWVSILEDESLKYHFQVGRTNVDLKDKWRTIKKANERAMKLGGASTST